MRGSCAGTPTYVRLDKNEKNWDNYFFNLMTVTAVVYTQYIMWVIVFFNTHAAKKTNNEDSQTIKKKPNDIYICV